MYKQSECNASPAYLAAIVKTLFWALNQWDKTFWDPVDAIPADDRIEEAQPVFKYFRTFFLFLGKNPIKFLFIWYKNENLYMLNTVWIEDNSLFVFFTSNRISPSRFCSFILPLFVCSTLSLSFDLYSLSLFRRRIQVTKKSKQILIITPSQEEKNDIPKDIVSPMKSVLLFPSSIPFAKSLLPFPLTLFSAFILLESFFIARLSVWITTQPSNIQ